MSGSSAKNFLQNGDTWVIGGEIQLVGDGVITKDGQPVVGGDGSGLDIPDGSITSAKIAAGAVTDDKLATPKLDKPPVLEPQKVIGTTLQTSDVGLVNYSQDPMADSLVMYDFYGCSSTNDPTQDTHAANKKYVDAKTVTAAQVSDATTVGRAVMKAADAAAARTAIGAGTSNQNLVLMTLSEAQTGTEVTARSVSAKLLADLLVGKINKSALSGLTPIADTANATATQVAEAYNSLLAALTS